MEKKINVIGITVRDLEKYQRVNAVLHDFSSIIIGRMGIPVKSESLSVITVLLEGTTDEIGSLTGRLGQIQGIRVKSMNLKV